MATDYDKKYFEPYISGDLGYKRKVREAEIDFKNEVLTELGILNHPKAKKAFGFAWQYGHGKYSEVYSYLVDFAELIK